MRETSFVLRIPLFLSPSLEKPRTIIGHDKTTFRAANIDSDHIS